MQEDALFTIRQITLTQTICGVLAYFPQQIGGRRPTATPSFMAGRSLDFVLISAMAGRLALAIAALYISFAAPSNVPVVFKLLRVPLCGQIVWVLLVLLIYRGWLYFDGQLRNIDLCLMFVVDSVLACATTGTAIAAVFTVDYIVRAQVCTTMVMCRMLGAASLLTLVVGALNAVSALGEFWILGSRFRLAHD